MVDSFRFDSVHVIESLASTDYRTGSFLATTVLPPLGVAVELHQPETAVALLDTLSRIAENGRREPHSPILHFEAHGNEDGLGTADGGFVSWWDMSDALIDINEASRLNLLVVLAACKGAHIVDIVRPTGRAPVWALLGPPDDVLQAEVADDIPRFYRQLLTSGDGRSALEAVNRATVAAGGWRYAFYSARYLFRVTWRRYLQEYGNPAARQNREDAIMAGLPTGGTLRQEREARAFFRAQLADEEGQFAEFRRRFFMIDRFPENDERFPLTIEDCRRDPADDPS